MCVTRFLVRLRRPASEPRLFSVMVLHSNLYCRWNQPQGKAGGGLQARQTPWGAFRANDRTFFQERRNMFTKKNSIAKAIVVITLAVVFLMGRAAGTSHFMRRNSASSLFTSYQMLPGYSYYISGHPFKPTAIVGLQTEYQLDSPHWRAVNLDVAQLRTWVNRMQEQPGAEYNVEPNGAYIVDNQGSLVFGLGFAATDLQVGKRGRHFKAHDDIPALQSQPR